jgi:hypothetical protein
VSSLRDKLDEARRIRFKPKKEQKIWEWIEESCELLPESGTKLKRAKSDRLDQLQRRCCIKLVAGSRR